MMMRYPHHRLGKRSLKSHLFHAFFNTILHLCGFAYRVIHGRRQLDGRGQLPPPVPYALPAAPSRREKKNYICPLDPSIVAT